jgi:hypothetical protein
VPSWINYLFGGAWVRSATPPGAASAQNQANAILFADKAANKPWVNAVEKYGADPTGADDSSGAIQEALDDYESPGTPDPGASKAARSTSRRAITSSTRTWSCPRASPSAATTTRRRACSATTTTRSAG